MNSLVVQGIISNPYLLCSLLFRNADLLRSLLLNNPTALVEFVCNHDCSLSNLKVSFTNLLLLTCDLFNRVCHHVV